MKRIVKLSRDCVLLAAMVVTLLLPTTTNAQSQIDGFFTSYSNETYNNRDLTITDGFLGANNQTFGENTPLGSGLLVMFAAGAGYVLLKKKED